ncbi:MAG: PBP1A family penicillin-binding protein [Deltaproteobacteria bacterium]|nr:PBP1A family penicillin-binding protein [Deltaproteobacteria bacterium]
MITSATIIQQIRILFYWVLTLSGLAALLVMGLFFLVVKDLPRVPKPLSRIIETPATEIIDKVRTIKALWVTLIEPGKVQGASTITQQLAKNLFFSFKRSYMRKFQELLVSLQIESQYNKNEILEAYMNQIPFGVGTYGVEQAARSFFGKPASDLTLPESALLAGLPKSPTRYNPYLHYDRAKKRQRLVLSRMVAVGYITPSDADRAFAGDLNLRPFHGSTPTGSYFLDMVVKNLEERYGPQVVYHGGLKVTTTLDPQLQSWAVASLQNGLAELDKMLGIQEKSGDDQKIAVARPQGALVSIETNSGAVKALVGGRNYLETEYNRALQNNRLPGSGFKPFLYYTALEKLGFHPATVVVDRPVQIPVAGAPDWKPKNFERRHEGPMVLKRALMKSVNTIAAQLVELTGPQAVIETAHRCGIESHLSPVYSLAMGTSGVSPLEMSTSFATFATGGIRHRPFWIWRVEDALGRVLEEKIASGERVLDASLTYQVVDMMRGVLDEGTGAVVRRLGFDLPAAGKTGTTNGFKDAWFTGFTPTLTTSVWVGYDREKGLKDTRGVGITGGRGAAPIWADFMIKATQGEPPRKFPMPSDIRFEKVDPNTGQAATSSTPNPLRVVLRESQTINKKTDRGESMTNSSLVPWDNWK